MHPIDPAEVAGLRFLANLFVRPQTISAIVEYWLRNYEPIARDTGALAPRSLEPCEFYHTLVARALVGPDDIVLVGQGNMATAANVPRYQHYLNFMQPARSDFSLAVPMRYFLESRERSASVLASLPLLLDAETFWAQRGHGATMGQHMCSFFRLGTSAGGLNWRALFPRHAFAIEIIYRVLTAILLAAATDDDAAAAAADWQAAHGATFLQRMVDAFRGHQGTDARVDKYVKDMSAELARSHSPFQKFATCKGLTYQLRRALRQELQALYATMGHVFDFPFALEDTESRPWEHLGVAHAPAALSFLWSSDGEQQGDDDDNDNDAMDID